MRKKKYCLDCGIEIFPYRSKRCRSCANKGSKNPAFGKQPRLGKPCTEETKEKIRNSNYHKNQKGKNNSNYIDGRTNFPYPMEFNESLKLIIRTRDNFTCQNCGMTEEEHKDKFNQVLHVHHIDYDKENLGHYNLITLCRICNVKANRNREKWKNLFSELISEV